MEPVSPVIPGMDLPEVIIAKEQHEYMPLPAYIKDGVVYTRWKMSEEEKKEIARTGYLYLMIWSGGRINPVAISASCPLEKTEE